MSRRTSFWAGVCLSMTVAVSAAAQSSDRAVAEALFRAGRQANARGDYATACQRFEDSNRLEPAVGTVFNLANCREKLGHLASAWQRYQEAVQKLPAGDERIAIASERAAALEPRVPKLTLTLAEGAPSVAAILKDGVELGSGSLGVELPIDPGVHALIVRAPGHEDSKISITLVEGEKRALTLELGNPKSTAAAVGSESPEAQSSVPLVPLAPPERDRHAPAQRTAGFVIGGVGAAGLVVGFVTGALVLSKKSTVDEECLNKRCSAEGLSAGDSGKTLSTVSTVAFVAGAAALGTGLVLVLTSNDHGSAMTTLGATAVNGGGGLRLGGRF